MSAANTLMEQAPEGFELLFPKTASRRLWLHLTFWGLFIGAHLLYFWPLSHQLPINGPTYIAYLFYYLRYIPVFYAALAAYDRLAKYLSGLRLWIIVLILSCLIMHLATVAMFFLVRLCVSVSQTSPAFKMLDEQFLSNTPFNAKDLFLILFDFEDLHLLMLPVGIKVFKYAITSERKRLYIERASLLKEIDDLKAQLSPHLTFNVLNAAYSEILPHSRHAASYLEALSSILRYALYENGTVVSLYKEIRCLKQIMKLESVRSQARASLSFRQQGRVKASHQIPSLLLVSLAENAIKHGIRQTHLESYVRVSVQIQDDMLHFLISNSLPTLAQSQTGKVLDSGLGLANITRRLNLQYAGRHTFVLKKTSDSFSVQLILPLEVNPLI